MSEVKEGTWPAKLDSWELAEVEFKDKKKSLKLVLWFQVKGDGWSEKLKWEQFLLKQDGSQNKKTFDTIKACEFKYSDLTAIVDQPDAFNTEKTYTVTVEPKDWTNKDGETKTFWNVTWVNSDKESHGAIKDKAVLKGHNLGKLNSFLGAPKPSIKNHAPQSNDDIDNFLS